jgi:1,4-alpha-glucan branching enzyme
MKKIFTLALLLAASFAYSQELSWTPDFIQETSNGIVITVNANYGNKGLLNYTPTTDVYIHTGVITNLSTSSSDWKHVRSVWATTYTWERATYIGNNQWQFTIDTTGGLRAFYGMTDGTEHIQKIAILFRSGNGNIKQANADGSDMYIPVYGTGEYARIDNPFKQPTYVPQAVPIAKNLGDNVPIVALASLAGSTIQIYFNGVLKSTVTGTKDSTNATITAPGTQTIIAKATNGSNTGSDTLTFFVTSTNTIAPLPAGTSDGINYYTSPDSLTLVLYAPHKNHVVVKGDFNNWAGNQMNETSDGLRYWITLRGLTSGTQYAYQYLIDDSIQVADYNSELVLDKNVDASAIVQQNFPGLKAFPSQASGSLAGVVQTGQTPYAWHDGSFVKPDKRNLTIYELLVRDFVATQSWNTLADTLNYLKKLGINAIEVMPFNNFEGASSWGYNSNFFIAPDKVYGTPAALKHFVDVCHQNGIAVIMDLAMDDVSGSSPLVQMYYNAKTNTPTQLNPWLDSVPNIPSSIVVGWQFNHTADANIALRNKVYASWINNYHIDGFRFDLAGGYTQTNYNTNGQDWQNTYDAGRVATWNNIYSSLQSIKAGTYCILESFVNYTEQLAYTNAGMMTWGNGGNETGAFTQASMGYSTNPSWDFSGGIYTSSGLTQPGLVTYAESHDEERMQYKNQTFGNSSGSYSTKDTATGLQRDAMFAAFWSMIPGPKMMYEFEELGYGFSINTCTDGTINNSCRTVPKPIHWEYLQNANRLALHNVFTKLLNLKINPAYLATFSTGSVNKNLSGAVKWMSVYSTALQVMVLGNFDVVQQTGTVSFPSTGTWYNLFTGKDTTVTSTSATNVTLAPGQYAVYVNTASALPLNWLSFTAQPSGSNAALLNWTTANEINNSYFEVERSNDGINFTAIGNVPSAAAGKGVNTYQFTDKHAETGINYYRLKQVDKDGAFSYSSVAAVTIYGTAGLWKVYPNPATSANTALYAQATLNNFAMSLTDISGKLLYRYSVNTLENGTKINIPVTGLAHGVYLLKITSDKASATEKIVVN